jgi:hypothetical protein
MSTLFRAVRWLAAYFWESTPAGFKTLWMSVPSGMRTVIITVVSIALVAAAFRIDRLWLRIVTYALAAMLIFYLIAQSLNYLSR